MLRTLSLFFLFALVPVQAAIYFAHNVSEDSGFINTKKYWTGDSDLCWAATASNMLQWWQNNSSGIPAFVPNGQNESGRTEIYDVFCNNWANTGKGIEIGLRWYLGGKPLNPNNYLYDFKETITEPQNTGRYWEGYITSLGLSSSTWEGDCPFISSKYFTQSDFPLQFGTDLVSFFQWDFPLLLHQVRVMPLPAGELRLTTLPAWPNPCTSQTPTTDKVWKNGTFIIMKRMEPCTWGARTALESTHTTP